MGTSYVYMTDSFAIDRMTPNLGTIAVSYLTAAEMKSQLEQLPNVRVLSFFEFGQSRDEVSRLLDIKLDPIARRLYPDKPSKLERIIVYVRGHGMFALCNITWVN